MEDKKATISFKDFAEDIKARYDETSEIDWLGQKIVIKHYLTFTEALAFVANVVDACYQDNGSGALVYMPEVKCYAINFNTIAFYTNIDLSNEEADDDTEQFDAYDFLMRSDILQNVFMHIDMNQMDEILNAVEDKLEYINSANTASIMSDIGSLNSAIEEIMPQIKDLFDGDNKQKLDNALGVIMEMAQDANIRKLAIEQVKHG